MNRLPDDFAVTAKSEAMTARQFVSFVMTSAVSAVFNLFSRWLLSHWILYELAVSLSYLVGMTIAFLLARRFVFEDAGSNWLSQYRRFAVVNVFGYLVTLAISAGLLRIGLPLIGWAWYPEEVAHFVGLASTSVTSYIGHKYYSFGRSSQA